MNLVIFAYYILFGLFLRFYLSDLISEVGEDGIKEAEEERSRLGEEPISEDEKDFFRRIFPFLFILLWLPFFILALISLFR